MNDFYTEMSRRMILEILFPYSEDDMPAEWEELAAHVEAVKYLEECLNATQ